MVVTQKEIVISPIACPKCGSANIHYVDQVPRVFRRYHVSDGVVIWDADNQETLWDACHSDSLCCGDCDLDFPVPEGVEVDFE